MNIPRSIKWIEVDLPKTLDYKEEIPAGEQPNCYLERVRMDLLDLNSRRSLFDTLSHESKSALIVTEGLSPYLTAEEIATLVLSR